MKLSEYRTAGALVAVMALVAAACGEPSGGPSTTARETTAVTEPRESVRVPSVSSEPPGEVGNTPAMGVLPEGPSALDRRDDPAFPAALVDVSEIISGGPPPDGIPPIDEPKFLPVLESLDLLTDDEPVVALEINGDARAYPVRIMIWHEIVNDVVGGVPVSVTYCPLCNSASTYVREIRGVQTTFGTSGRLYLSALVMYDRATESLWTHFDGRAVVGMLTGEELEAIASPLLSWADFRAAYPDGLVLDETRTGYSRSYGRNPYVGYDDPDTYPFLFRGDDDARAVAKQRIVGITRGDETKAYTLEAVSGELAMATNDNVGGDDVVILWKAGQASALDADAVDGGRDVGSVGVFLRTTGTGMLTFTARDGDFVDDQTGSIWSVVGEAISGPLEGTRLERVAHLDTFWFAWATYRPDTVLITEPLS